MAAIDFTGFMATMAQELLGPPNPALSSKTELRFGQHGSVSVDLVKCTYFDHERKIGGGALDLIAWKTGRHPNGAAGGAIEWLVDRHYIADAAGPSSATPKSRIVACYDYCDELGELLFQVVRMEPKTFRQRRRSREGDELAKVNDGWVWSVKGVRLVPYRFPNLLEALAEERLIFIVEGEKDVDNLLKAGVPATCNPMGAGKWPESFPEFFRGADVVILPDNDEAGRTHRDLVGSNLKAVAGRIRTLDLPNLPAKGDVSDWLAAGGTTEQLYALVDQQARTWDGATLESRFGAIWFADIGREAPRRDWVVKGLFGTGELGVLWGFSGSGKSFLALDCALTIALAASGRLLEPLWFGLRVYPGGVIYVAPEGGLDLRLRVIAWRESHGIPAGTNLPFVLMPTPIDLASRDDDTDSLIEEIKRHAAQMKVPLRLVVVDTLARAMAGQDENASADMGAFIRNCELIQRSTGAHVLPVHHAGNDKTKERGHTSLRAAVDTSIEVAKPEDGGPNSWTIRKLKSGTEGGVHQFRLQQIPIGVDDDGDPITSCVIRPSETVASAGQGRARPLSREARLALRALHDALIDEGLPAPGSLQLPIGVRVVTRDSWRVRMVAALVDPDEDRKGDKVRQRLRRVQIELDAARLIGRQEPYFWLARDGPPP